MPLMPIIGLPLMTNNPNYDKLHTRSLMYLTPLMPHINDDYPNYDKLRLRTLMRLTPLMQQTIIPPLLIFLSMYLITITVINDICGINGVSYINGEEGRPPH